MTQGQFIFLTYANGVSGAPGPATTHSVSDFTVQNLDALVVKLVAAEVANQTGGRVGGDSQIAAPVLAAAIPPSREQWLAGFWGGLMGQLMSAGALFWGALLFGCFFLGKKMSVRARLAHSAPTPMKLNPPGDGPILARARVSGDPEEEEELYSDLTIWIGPSPEREPVALAGGQRTMPLRRSDY